MVPIIAGLMLLYAVLQRDNKPAMVQVNPSRKKDKPQHVPVSPRRVVKPAFKNNLQQPVGIEEYQKSVIQPSPFLASPQLQLAKFFKDKYTKLPHVSGVASPMSPTASTRQFEDGQTWLICSIPTKYKNIYLSLMLSETGNIPMNTPGVLISFDDVRLNYLLRSCDVDQEVRFGRVVYRHQSIVDSEQLLQLLIGDELHPFTVNRYLSQREAKY